MDNLIKEKAEYWAGADVFDDQTKGEIRDLLDQNAVKELTDRFYRDLEFGTGGLRGIIGAGTSRMNIYNIRKATSALSSYLKEVFREKDLISVAISYDSRRFSREFAQAAASVLAAYGIRSIITKELRPVPMLSFMVRKYECQAGICITASHNPPEYNGYKVYWNTGGQLVPPHDKEIIKLYNGIESYDNLPSISYEEGLASDIIKEVKEELDEDYLTRVQGLAMRAEEKKGNDQDIKIVYSPLHGTGLYPVTEALKRFGFNDVHIVPEQEKPDSDFPTVKSPNPEDKEALYLAVELAKKLNADLVMGTDPDSDRLGLVVREGDEFIPFNGNQIGSLLMEYILSSLKEKDKLPDNSLVIKTIVTTDLQKDIADFYNTSCEDTLTGFKWICDRVEEYESGVKKPYKKFICGGEESYGFLVDTFVRDKDAVISCAVAAEMVAFYKSKGLTLSKVLDQLFKRFGVYMESLFTVTLPGMDGAMAIKNKMQKLRSNPPTLIDNVQVQKLLDFAISQEKKWDGNGFVKSDNIELPQSNVLQFVLEDGTKVTARPSGTEPKIKFYFSVRTPVAKDIDDAKLEEAKKLCCERLKRIEDTFVAMME